MQFHTVRQKFTEVSEICAASIFGKDLFACLLLLSGYYLGLLFNSEDGSRVFLCISTILYSVIFQKVLTDDEKRIIMSHKTLYNVPEIVKSCQILEAQVTRTPNHSKHGIYTQENIFPTPEGAGRTGRRSLLWLDSVRKISESLVYEDGGQRHWTGTYGGPHRVVAPTEKSSS